MPLLVLIGPVNKIRNLKKKARFIYLYLLPLLCLLLCSHFAGAQSTLNTGQPTTLTNTPQRDTNANKSNTSKWKRQDARIYFKKLNSERIYTPDTETHIFHRLPFSQPWNRDLGNFGSPTQSLMFTPEDRLGPTLGYHVMDVYRFNLDSLNYYNTTRPYSVFSFHLGSKLEQLSQIMVTENIKPNWNFSVEYHKTVSPGSYLTARNNHDNANFTTNYISPNQHYEVRAAMVYNKEQHDENGGLANPGQLDSLDYNDRKTVSTRYQNELYSITRSPVFNVQRDFGVLLQHSYTWGRGDTLYNQDSTSYTYKLTPRFRITHKLELSTEKHDFKDLTPDSLRYTSLFHHAFSNEGYYTPALSDTVFSEQRWFWIDNRILLNGLFGKVGNQLEFNAGIGNRFDEFATAYGSGITRTNMISNYLIGEIKKEALQSGEWFYHANAQFFFTGTDAGDFLLHGTLGRDLKNNAGSVEVGFQQQLNNAPYNYTIYENEYTTINTSFNKESVTEAYGSLQSNRFRFSAGVKVYLIDNYIYINEAQRPAQYTDPFNLTELWVRKVIKIGSLVLDNELVYQEKTGSAPVNIPTLLGRHQLSYERGLFGNALRLVTGIQVQYNTSYHPAGYDPLLNRFYYQTSYVPPAKNNFPECSVFFNFRVTRRFRAFVTADELQEAILQEPKINYPGYPAQDVAIRFGFAWVLIN